MAQTMTEALERAAAEQRRRIVAGATQQVDKRKYSGRGAHLKPEEKKKAALAAREMRRQGLKLKAIAERLHKLGLTPRVLTLHSIRSMLDIDSAPTAEIKLAPQAPPQPQAKPTDARIKAISDVISWPLDDETKLNAIRGLVK
jgi:hypothetical protein